MVGDTSQAAGLEPGTKVPGHVGFSLPGGVGFNRAPQNWGGGFRKRARLTGTINQSL